MPLMKKILTVLLAFFGFIVLLALLYNLPPVHDRLAWRVDNLRTSIKYALNPPEDVVFLPGGETSGTPVAQLATPTTTPEPSPTPQPTGSPQPSPTSPPTSTPLPAEILLEGVKV
jgi:hypothetical protein